MNPIQHIKYYRYIAAHWGVKLALFTSYHEWRGELKYGINSTSFQDLSALTITGNQLSFATEYMPASYFTLEKIFAHLPAAAREGDFLDIGCGKGRALCVAAHAGFTSVKGIDFAKELLVDAECNLQHTKQLFPALNYELLWQDLSGLTIADSVSTIFLFNPFNEVLTQLLLHKIQDSLNKAPRPFYILYATPRHEELLFEADYDVLYRVKKMDYLEGVVFKKT